MNRRLKKALPLLGALVFLMVGAALAVPSITVDIQGIGAGSGEIDNPIVSTTVNWTLDSTDPDILDNILINVTASRDLSTENGKLIIKFYDDADKLVFKKEVAVSTLTWNSATGGYWATVDLGTSITLNDGTESLTIQFGTTKLEEIFTSSHAWINKVSVIYQES